MLIIGLFLFLTIFIIIYINSASDNYTYSVSSYNNESPKIIHLIYIPWDKQQKLKDNHLDFDMKPYIKLKQNNPDYNIKLWTLPDIQEFVRNFYPENYNDIFDVPRPVMIVDIIRLLVVYHYGGIYWQYGSIRKVNSMDIFQPSNDKKVKLFTEIVLSDAKAQEMKNEPIRNGEPEEKIRVCTQIFSAVPKHPYIFKLFKTALNNKNKYQVKRDYDILYITGNAMMSTVYNQTGKNMNDIELVDYDTTQKIIKISSSGSWRKEKETNYLDFFKTIF